MAAEQLILAIDQGTTNTKVILIDDSGRHISQAAYPVEIAFPQPGWVEQDAGQTWRSVQLAMEACLDAAGRPTVAAVAVSNQRETALMWERETGRPVGPVVSWQCRRSTAICSELRTRETERLVAERSGLALDPMFTASKFRWLLDHTPDGVARARAGELCVGTVDSWLVWNLTGGSVHACDVTNASRTQLFHIHDLKWDDYLLDLFGVPRETLPHVLNSGAVFGETRALGMLADGIPVAGVVGDSHGALFGHARFEDGAVKATYGTGSSLMMATPQAIASTSGLSTTIAWGYPKAVYALEGNIYMTGATVGWLADFLGRTPDEIAAMAEEVESTEGLYLVPGFVGLGAPYWRPDVTGLVTGLTRGATARHMARAVIESIAYQIRDVFESMAVDTGRPAVLLADGGATRNNMLMQFQADILGCPVVRNNSTDLSALGAAYLAGLTVGIWKSYDDLAALPHSVDVFEPTLPEAQREALYGGWRRAMARALIGDDFT